MRLSKYQIYQDSEDENWFWFESTGLKGTIIKAVVFEELNEQNRFNLGMGDYNETKGEVNDINLTNNRDARKVFATIGEIVKVYTSLYPDREIFITGNTIKKKDIYSIMISAFLNEISNEFYIWGANAGEEYEIFEKDKIYEVILVKRK